MKTVDYDAAGMPVSVSVEYALRCQLLDLAARVQDGKTRWLYLRGRPRELGIWAPAPVHEDRSRDIIFIADTMKENGVIEIVEFKPA